MQGFVIAHWAGVNFEYMLLLFYAGTKDSYFMLLESGWLLESEVKELFCESNKIEKQK